MRRWRLTRRAFYVKLFSRMYQSIKSESATMQQTLDDGVYFDGEYWRVKRLGRAYGRRRVGGKYANAQNAIEARNYAMYGADRETQEWMNAPAGAYPQVPTLPTIPDNINLIEQQPLTLNLDRWLYATDWHVPLHNREYIKRLMLVAKHHSVKHLVIGGDFFDFASSSNHVKTEQQASLNQTLRVGGGVLASLCEVFTTIAILPGNHCLRVARKLNEPLDFDLLVHAALKGRGAGQVTTTNYDYLYINNDWVVGHPRFFEGSTAGGLAKAAMRERRNIIGAHTHALSLSYTPDGQHLVIYPGHMSNARLTPYIMQSKGLSKFPEWRNGFVMIDDGIVTLFADGLTKWGVYGTSATIC
jgi:hypothetical protein